MSSGSVRWLAPAMLAVVIVTAVAQRAEAMPMFARKLNMQCAQCHTMPPRLTPLGYKFLRSGYRLQGAEEEAPSPTNALFFNTEVSASSTHNPGDSGTDSRGFESSGSEIQLATPVGPDLAGKFAYEVPADGAAGVGEAWVQYNKPAEGPIMSLKAGQLSVMSGFALGGARTFTLTDPLIFGSDGPLTGEGQGNFSLTGLERGLEFGVTQGPLTGKLSWLNGVDATGAGNVPLAGKRAKDIAIQGEYLLGESGTHIGAILYSGKAPITADYENKFNRAAVFGTYAYPLKAGGKMGEMTLELSGAYLWGKDQIAAPVVSAGDSLTLTRDAKSKGALLELSLYQLGKTAFTLRYDTLKPSDVAGTLTTKATTFAASHMLSNNLRIAAELRKLQLPDILNRFGSDKKHTSAAYTLILAAQSGSVILEQIPRSTQLDRALERAIASTIDTYTQS